jgi:hypothetical protein
MDIVHRNNKLATGIANNNLLQKPIWKKITCGKLGFSGIMLFAALLLWLSPAYSSGTITETFINNDYNGNLWYLGNQGQGTTAQITNNRLEVTVAGNGYSNFTGVGFSLTGDFDMKVDFTLINWPASNGTQLAIGTFIKSPSNLFQMARANGNGREQYFNIILGNYHETVVIGPGLSGTLRMVRTGNKMEGFYWDGNKWQLVASATDASLGQEVGVNLGIGPYGNNYSGIPAKVAFSNIRITYNTGPSHGKPGPAITDLLLN